MWMNTSRSPKMFYYLIYFLDLFVQFYNLQKSFEYLFLSWTIDLYAWHVSEKAIFR